MIRFGSTVVRAAVTAMLLVSCSENPGETTQKAAVTGGVIGAGLGAIIGNQTGSTATGLAIGGIAGAGTGAMIGSSLETRESSLRVQEESIVRQDQQIQAQRREINELRQQRVDRTTSGTAGALSMRSSGRDGDHQRLASAYARARTLRENEARELKSHKTKKVATSRSTNHKVALAHQSKTSKSKVHERVASTKVVGKASAPKSEQVALRQVEQQAPAIEEKSIEEVSVIPEGDDSSKGAYDWSNSTASKGVEGSAVGSSDCELARGEITQGENVKESAEKLFHYRRALRLCPNNAAYHVRLGEVYQSLKRPTDAAYEFKEALNLDPQNSRARELLGDVAR